MTTTQNTFAAHVNSAVAAIQEWQRGGCTWAECLRRADVTARGNDILAELSRTSDDNTMRQTASRAVAAA